MVTGRSQVGSRWSVSRLQVVAGRLHVVTGRLQVGYRWVAGRLQAVTSGFQFGCR